MHIGLVSPYDFAYPGGVTVHVTHLSKQFNEMGHTAKIIAPSSQPNDSSKPENLIVVGRPTPVPSGGSIARIALSLRLGPKLKEILREEQFDIVHIHEPMVPLLPITALRHSQTINVGTFHAYHGSNLVLRYTQHILKRWFRKLHGKIAVSRPAMEFASKYFPGYYNIIPNGVDLDHFAKDVPLIEEFRDGKQNILFVGRPEKRKGLKYLLGAFARLKWEFPNLRLIVVGPGKLDEDSERILSERGLQDVVLVGPVSYEELPRYYKTADVFCAPSIGKESFGIVLLEAMAAGRPVVAFYNEGYASVIASGVEGLLVTTGDEEALASALLRLLQDENLRAEIGARGRKKAEDYRWEIIARKVMDYYERLLSEMPSHRRPPGEFEKLI
ncbi:MAG: glycosyltransferase family 4 protein [Chloroflexi bacterium]|nr:glycosyltransferase family 4 protein [Chloroflexota bacterium]